MEDCTGHAHFSNQHVCIYMRTCCINILEKFIQCARTRHIRKVHRRLKMTLRLLLLLVAVGLCSAQCPTGCSCTTTTINCNRINSLPSFSSPSVTRIQIDNINSSIHFNAFKAVPKLESIFIRNGNISFIATCAFGEIPAKSIGIVNVRIGVIGRGAFKDLHNVGRSISIHNCQIGQISSNAFYRLSNITLLSLNTNNISTIQTYAFNKITSGTSLNVFHNNITTINSYAFNFGPNVFSTYAFMTGGSIMNIGCQALNGLRTITYPTLRCDCDLVPLVQSPIYLGRVNCFSQSQLHDVISGSINDCTKPTLREPGYCVF